MEKSYFTVKELAEIVGVSKQAIYKRMSGDLSTYVVLVENKKCLNSAVLERFAFNYSTKKVENSTELKVLQKMVELLENENEIKQKRIELLESQNAEEHQKLMELTTMVGNSLQSISEGQLAAQLIEGKRILDEDTLAPKKKKRRFWK